MSLELVAGVLFGLILMSAVGGAVWVRRPKKLKTVEFLAKWKELQGYCRDKQTWPNAVEQADRLLDKALKKRKFKGSSMGERMVSAQRIFTDNDSAWFAHNLYKKLKADPGLRIKESDVKDALVGFRQALRDVGALPDNSNAKNQEVNVKK